MISEITNGLKWARNEIERNILLEANGREITAALVVSRNMDAIRNESACSPIPTFTHQG